MVNILYLCTVLVVILVSMTMHEAMHGYVAYWLGDDTAKLSGRLTLNPLKHIDPFMTIILPLVLAVCGLPVFGGAKPVPFNPTRLKYGEWGSALVAIAGPLTNFILAFLFYALYVAVRPMADSVGYMILSTGVLVNLGFFLFNILPIPPLDGSRILYALAPDSARRVMEAIERYDTLLVFVIVLMASQYITNFMQAGTGAIIKLFSNIFGISM